MQALLGALLPVIIEQIAKATGLLNSAQAGHVSTAVADAAKLLANLNRALEDLRKHQVAGTVPSKAEWRAHMDRIASRDAELLAAIAALPA